MGIYFGVSIDVVEHLTVRAFHADGELPRTSPLLYVALGECFGGTLQFGNDALHLSAVVLAYQFDVTIFSSPELRLAEECPPGILYAVLGSIYVQSCHFRLMRN